MLRQGCKARVNLLNEELGLRRCERVEPPIALMIVCSDTGESDGEQALLLIGGDKRGGNGSAVIVCSHEFPTLRD
jgi:hypothetical protein